MDNKDEALTEKQKATEVGKDIAETTANAVGRGAGFGSLMNFATKTRGGQKALESTGKKLSNGSPITRKMLANVYDAKNSLGNSLNDGSSDMGDNYDEATDSNDAMSNDIGFSGSGKKDDSKVSALWNALPTKTKLIIIGVIVAVIFVVIFLILLITPLMHLGIIDISKSGSSSGLNYPTSTYLNNIYNDCKTIVVGGQSWPLEDYIAGVVAGEAWGVDQNMEALKAQAVAARTYAIHATGHCQRSIANSQSAQVFVSKPDERSIEAAQATAGLVMTYNDELFLSEYDSFYTGRDYSCDLEKCTVTYKKHPNYEKHVVSAPISLKYMIGGGHGYGMSQVASYALADEGYNFEEILKYFYSPGVQINSLYNGGYTNGLSASGNFMVRTVQPNEGNKYYFSDEIVSFWGSNVGQCTWYAYCRANEILDYAGSDLKWTIGDHAKNWFNRNLDSGANAFSYSTDVTEPKEGAIIVWGSNRFGHVAVVEKVNDDGTIDYTEANIHSAKSSSNPYGFRYQKGISYTDTGVGTISSIWNGYTFLGYIYMVE